MRFAVRLRESLWIEIQNADNAATNILMSGSVRACGLKSEFIIDELKAIMVRLRESLWIEINDHGCDLFTNLRQAP